KSLGQNFLHDRNLAKWIVDQSNIGSKDFVIEIGTGLGALTELALANAAGVVAIEKDNRLAEYLRARFQSYALEIVHGDAMEVDSALVRISERDPRELPACEYKAFQKLVRRGFSQRRKQLGKLIREELPDWEDAAVELGLNTRARAEELSLEQWIALTNRIAPIHAEVINDAPEEQFPVVDEEDRLKGTALRSKVHANNFLHRAVHVLIFHPVGEAFLQMRSRRKDRHPLAWDSSAAGHVNAGEDYD